MSLIKIFLFFLKKDSVDREALLRYFFSLSFFFYFFSLSIFLFLFLLFFSSSLFSFSFLSSFPYSSSFFNLSLFFFSLKLNKKKKGNCQNLLWTACFKTQRIKCYFSFSLRNERKSERKRERERERERKREKERFFFSKRELKERKGGILLILSSPFLFSSLPLLSFIYFY